MSERVKVYAAWVIVGFGGLFAAYLFFKYAAGVLLPFAVGWLAALAVRRPAEALHRVLKIKEGALRLLLAVLGVLLFGALLFFGLRGLLAELSNLAARVEEPFLLFEKIKAFFASLPFLSAWTGSGEMILLKAQEALLAAIPRAISGIAGVLPSLFLSVGVAVVSAVYFCLDLDRVHAACLRILPKKWHVHLRSAKESALRAALTVLRANLILMLIAFLGMLIGFSVLGLPYPFLLSSVFAVFDFLPVIGVGTFLLPWAFWLMFSGSIGKGIGVLVIFGVITAVRQFIEPRLLGAGTGIHPLLTLLSMYVGARFFGAPGIILAPMLTLLVFGVLSAPAEISEETASTCGRADTHRFATKKE